MHAGGAIVQQVFKACSIKHNYKKLQTHCEQRLSISVWPPRVLVQSCTVTTVSEVTLTLIILVHTLPPDIVAMTSCALLHPKAVFLSDHSREISLDSALDTLKYRAETSGAESCEICQK